MIHTYPNPHTLPKQSPRYKAGFTLIEALVVTAILVLLSSFFIVKYQSFNSSIIVSSLAYDVALSIRQAQVFGISVQFFDSGFGSGFDSAYGVHFSSTDNTRYTLYADSNNNYFYDDGMPSLCDAECVTQYQLNRGNFISNFCATLSSGAEQCVSGTGDTITDLHILFRRPNPDAIIKSDDMGDSFKSARIVIESPEGNIREIRVFLTGQISLQ